MGRFVKKIKNKRYGQAMAEFALTIPIFLLLVFGVIELSRFFLTYSAVFTAAREATRYGTTADVITREINGSDTSIFKYQDCTGIIETAVRTGSFAGIDSSSVTVSYETEPGVPDPAPECDLSNLYEAEMGDRVKVQVQSTYQPILGIVPPITVSADNGRTIMMSIIVAKEPDPIDLCVDNVTYENATPQEGDDNILYVDLSNSSAESSFIVYQILDVEWIVTSDSPKLMEIRWTADENPIWIADIEEGRLPPLTIPDAGSLEYWKEHTRNLTPGATNRLEFVFNQAVDQDEIELSFDVIMQHANLPTDFCWPVE